MLMRTNSLETCIYITVMVFILVVLMPAIDIFVCKKPAPSKQIHTQTSCAFPSKRLIT